MATAIKNHEEVTIGVAETEYEFTKESIGSCEQPTQLVIIKTNSANTAGSLQFAAGNETFTSQKTIGPDETVYISIKNGQKNLKVKSTVAGQKFHVMI